VFQIPSDIRIYVLVEVVHWSSETGSNKQAIKRESKSPTKEPRVCVGNTWKTVGKYRFWQRVACVQRRTDNATMGTTTDITDLLPSQEVGPPRNGTYDPNYGHEPYWADGGWVYDKFVPTKNGSKYMCGVRCALLFLEYGKICARDENYKLQTFESFCAMKSSDCSGKNGWTPLHKGECYRTLITHYTYDARGRAEKAILEVSKRHRNLEPYVGVA
ncbi:hypothetical protein HW555_003658, partial [Spodoptera exigua]